MEQDVSLISEHLVVNHNPRPNDKQLICHFSNDIITHYQNIDGLKDDITEFIPEEVIK